ncbi:MAG TPA: thiamine diphosphokinase [Candidatus Saccharimonadales bacterium]|nr:thiamine diphosphokinase [Candidatus Saccharimonadales bacterium]
MQAIVLADGAVGTRATLDAAWPGWLVRGAVVIAADGGARHAEGLDLTIDRWVGDGDSLGSAGLDALVAAGIPVELSPTDKDESDTELALRAALDAGADDIVVLGALGGPRLDHALANLGLLTLSEVAGVELTVLAVDARIRLLGAQDGGRLALPGRAGDLVTLLPVGADVEGVTTEGLRYPLRDERLVLGRTRGLSNIRERAEAAVTIRSGRLLVVETPATLRG